MERLLVLALCAVSVLLYQHHCNWKDPRSSYSYDITPLPHRLEVNILGSSVRGDYHFNFCDGPRPKCRGEEVSVTEFVEILGMESESSCSVLGAHHTPEYKAFNIVSEGHGFSMIFRSSMTCMEFNPNTHHMDNSFSTTQFNVHCHPGSTTFEKSQMNSSRCHQIFSVFSPAGCPVGHPHHRFHLGRRVVKVLCIWLAVLTFGLIGFAMWVDPDKTIFKQLHIVLDKAKAMAKEAKLRVKNAWRRRQLRRKKEVPEEYTSMGNRNLELEEI